MKKLLALLALTALGVGATEKRRLESVTWDPVKHELRWVISKGEIEGDTYKPGSRQEYEISIDEATMSSSDETRRFSKQEAQSVRRLLDILARYAGESTIWWEQGQGEPVKKGIRVSLPQPPHLKCKVDGDISSSEAVKEPLVRRPQLDAETSPGTIDSKSLRSRKSAVMAP